MRPLWQWALALWFALEATIQLTNFRFTGEGFVMGVVAAIIVILWVLNK